MKEKKKIVIAHRVPTVSICLYKIISHIEQPVDRPADRFSPVLGPRATKNAFLGEDFVDRRQVSQGVLRARRVAILFSSEEATAAATMSRVHDRGVSHIPIIFAFVLVPSSEFFVSSSRDFISNR